MENHSSPGLANRSVTLLLIAASILTLTSVVVFVLLRTSGLGPYHYPGAPRPLPLLVEGLALAAAALLLLGRRTRQSATTQFFLFGFLATQSVVLAFGFDPASVPLQVAAVCALIAGVIVAVRASHRIRRLALSIVVAFGGVVAALATVLIVNRI